MDTVNTTVDRAVSRRHVEVVDGFDIESFGAAFSRYGLALVLFWIGCMKFTAYEAMGIAPLVSHIRSWRGC